MQNHAITRPIIVASWPKVHVYRISFNLIKNRLHGYIFEISAYGFVICGFYEEACEDWFLIIRITFLGYHLNDEEKLFLSCIFCFVSFFLSFFGPYLFACLSICLACHISMHAETHWGPGGTILNYLTHLLSVHVRWHTPTEVTHPKSRVSVISRTKMCWLTDHADSLWCFLWMCTRRLEESRKIDWKYPYWPAAAT